jgi:DNA-binding GntR family transcriptional regulator
VSKPDLLAAEAGRASATYQSIKQRIMNRTYAPGGKLSEARLAAELGVGRSPVRSALARLQSEGWIAVSPQSGTYVKGLNEDEMKEIFELRLLLEPAAAALAAQRMPAATIEDLIKAFSAFGTQTESRSIDEYFALDLQLHRLIHEAAGNRLISSILLNLLDKVVWIQRGSSQSPGRRADAFHEISDLLDALVKRDPQRAADVMREHITRTARFRGLSSAER